MVDGRSVEKNMPCGPRRTARNKSIIAQVFRCCGISSSAVRLETVRYGSTLPKQFPSVRSGYTLLELMLALSLVVVATALIGSLMSLYARSFSTRAEDVKRKQLARGLLAMISDDIRSVVVPSSFDSDAFEKLFGPEKLDLENVQLTADEADPLGLGSGLESETEQASSSQTGTDTTMATDMSTSLGSSLPLGIYGNQTQLMIDVSRIPRIDEFSSVQMNVGQAALGTLVDIPGDMKRITYYVQLASPLGVQDRMLQVDSGLGASNTASASSGLVRRQIDRLVTSFAEASGLTSQLTASGDLVAPEVISLEFSYFDGAQWVNQWDSSQMGFPWLVNIVLAVQSATGEQKNGVPQGIQISTMPIDQRRELGIEVYQVAVAIPGAQLIPKPTTSVSESTTDSEGTGSSSTAGGGVGL